MSGLELSIISPVYRAREILRELVARISSEMEKLGVTYEIILVDDASPDDSWSEIELICRDNLKVRGIRLSRNFGQHKAVTAGLAAATGRYTIILDCDLQDNPVYIGMLYHKVQEGFDTVFTVRRSRKQFFLKRLAASIYNRLFRFFSDQRYRIDYGSLVIFSSRVRSEFLKLKDQDRLYVQMLKWIGFKQSSIEVEHDARFAGKSSYSFFKLLNLAIQGWTAHSSTLLYFSVYVGVVFATLAFIALAYIFLYYFLYGFASGWASLISVMLFFAGVILISTGILGIYIGRIFEQCKDRQLYIIDQQVNFSEER
jgi:glycosyltransferase involved in cell wall biosynthesis